jgi:amino acid transporter
MGAQVVTSIGIVIALLATPDVHEPASFVFTTWENRTGFGSKGYVMLLGLLFSTFSFSGYEAGAHMAEETKNASTAAPWGIVTTVLMVAVVGFVYILGLLFSTRDVDDVIEYGIVHVYTAACGLKGGLFLAGLLIMNLFFAGMSSLTVTSRIGFAMARDGAFPGSEMIRVVNQKVKMPLRTVFLVFVVDVIILLIPLGSTVAFAAVTSITTIGSVPQLFHEGVRVLHAGYVDFLCLVCCLLCVVQVPSVLRDPHSVACHGGKTVLQAVRV